MVKAAPDYQPAELLLKVVKKIVAEAIADYCEMADDLNQGQPGSRKERSTIDTFSCLILSIHEA